jgi:glutamate N-acetyltransferase / amino-acid N-acetyltransferase
VIGEPLDPEKFAGVLDGSWRGAAPAPGSTPPGDHDHRHLPQGRHRARPIDRRRATVTINGIAKGAGMIAPDMATMLSFVFTDAPIAAPVLQALLSRRASRPTFNAITVDGDTSTSDTLLLFATGAAPRSAARRRSTEPATAR